MYHFESLCDVSSPDVELCKPHTVPILWYCTRTVVFAHAPFVVNHIQVRLCVNVLVCRVEVKCTCSNNLVYNYRIGELGHTLHI